MTVFFFLKVYNNCKEIIQFRVGQVTLPQVYNFTSWAQYADRENRNSLKNKLNHCPQGNCNLVDGM